MQFADGEKIAIQNDKCDQKMGKTIQSLLKSIHFLF